MVWSALKCSFSVDFWGYGSIVNHSPEAQLRFLPLGGNVFTVKSKQDKQKKKTAVNKILTDEIVYELKLLFHHFLWNISANSSVKKTLAFQKVLTFNWSKYKTMVYSCYTMKNLYLQK